MQQGRKEKATLEELFKETITVKRKRDFDVLVYNEDENDSEYDYDDGECSLD